ncbi:hypothetical protein RchiOBHm_Chr2g0159141 [Rosa chinensis]|uniref:Uncharacterized protein n=1 Tax=Rosa chinensis TaxID=74649 RepID=A0A2P6S268_ROSCH|nr:hypothetical protein RchiOBHm_Chr2g0159141 [Rosa chinensis]
MRHYTRNFIMRCLRDSEVFFNHRSMELRNMVFLLCSKYLSRRHSFRYYRFR